MPVAPAREVDLDARAVGRTDPKCADGGAHAVGADDQVVGGWAQGRGGESDSDAGGRAGGRSEGGDTGSHADAGHGLAVGAPAGFEEGRDELRGGDADGRVPVSPGFQLGAFCKVDFP